MNVLVGDQKVGLGGRVRASGCCEDAPEPSLGGDQLVGRVPAQVVTLRRCDCARANRWRRPVLGGQPRGMTPLPRHGQRLANSTGRLGAKGGSTPFLRRSGCASSPQQTALLRGRHRTSVPADRYLSQSSHIDAPLSPTATLGRRVVHAGQSGPERAANPGPRRERRRYFSAVTTEVAFRSVPFTE